MHLRPLNPLLQKKAQNELNEKPARLNSDISTLKQWLRKQPHLQSVNPSDQWLASFLRGNKFSLEKCKEKLDMYYTLRTLVPEIFQNRNPFDPNIQGILKLGVFLPLNVSVAEDACRIFLQRLGAFDSSNYKFVDLMKVTFMILEILILEDDNFIIAGEVTTIIEKALPLRFKSGHILHSPPGFETAYAIFRAFLAEKLKKRFSVYSRNYEAIYDVIPRNVFPKEYGGEQESLQELTDYWKKKVESYADWFLNEENARSDESLRTSPITTSSLFGMEGTFRQLEVD